jgi:hypothetical protein
MKAAHMRCFDCEKPTFGTIVPWRQRLANCGLRSGISRGNVSGTPPLSEAAGNLLLEFSLCGCLPLLQDFKAHGRSSGFLGKIRANVPGRSRVDRVSG